MFPNRWLRATSFDARRASMVENQIRRRGVEDRVVLAAFQQVPRHLFVPAAKRALAYSDRALAIGPNSTISQPYIVALMTAALTPESAVPSPDGERGRILEIGTGSGYQSAILAACGYRVYSVENQESISRVARLNLEATGYLDSVSLRVGDGALGWPEEAPFDGILMTAAARELPAALPGQLAPTGTLVAPLGPPSTQVIRRGRFAGGELVWENLEPVRFIPLRTSESPD